MPERSTSASGGGGIVGNLALLGGLLAVRSVFGWLRRQPH